MVLSTGFMYVRNWKRMFDDTYNPPQKWYKWYVSNLLNTYDVPQTHKIIDK